MNRVTISLDDFNAVIEQIRSTGVRVIMPDEPERAIVVDVLMLAHIAVPGWSRSDTADGVSVALPALPSPLPEALVLAGAAVAPFSQLGAAGIEALAKIAGRNTVSFSPRAVATRDVWTVFHETSHLEQTVAGGGLVHGARYIASREYAMLAAEGPAYACNVAGAAWCDGADPAHMASTYADGLRPYGADDSLVSDAHDQLDVHARAIAAGLCPNVRALIEGVRFLRSRGVRGLPELPA